MSAAFRRDPRYLVALAALCAAVGCSKEDEPDKPHRPAPIPTTPEHRKPMSAAEVKRFEALAAEQIDRHKEALAAKCYVPAKEEAPPSKDAKIDPEALKKAASGSSSSLSVLVVFDEEGKEATREVIEDSENGRGLAQCVGDNLPPLSVPPPKRKVRVKVRLAFP